MFLSSRKHATFASRCSVARSRRIRPNYGAGEPYLAGKQKNVRIKRIKSNLSTRRTPRNGREDAATLQTRKRQRETHLVFSGRHWRRARFVFWGLQRWGSARRRVGSHTNSLSAALSCGPAFQAWLGRDGRSAPRVPAGKSEAPPLRAAFTGPTSKKQTRILKSCRFAFENELNLTLYVGGNVT